MDHPCPDIRRAPRVALCDSPAEQQFLENAARERHGQVIPVERTTMMSEHYSHTEIAQVTGEGALYLDQLN